MALRRSNDDLVTVQARHLTGVLQDELFPTFDCASEPFTDFAAFADCGPSANSDVATALVFVAGFGEKLVPNVLDRLLAPTSAR